MIIWAHPCIGKTYALSQGFVFLDWDNIFNKRRDLYLKEHNLTKANMYKDKDFIKYMSKEWEKAKEYHQIVIFPLLASPAILLELFSDDFDLVIALTKNEFIKRNIQRGGTYEDSIKWKNWIDSYLDKVDHITTDKYLQQLWK